MTIRELTDKHLALCRARGLGKSALYAKDVAGRYLQRFTTEVGDLEDPDLWDSVRDRLEEEAWTDGHRRHAAMGLRQLVRFAEELGQVRVGTSAMAPQFKAKTPPLPACTDQEFEILYAGVRNLQFRTALCLAYDAGLRTMETANLQVPDVDLENEVLIIRNGKGGKGAVIPILTERLLRQLRLAVENVPHHGRIALAPPAKKGERYWKFRYRLPRVCARLGLRPICFHDLRRGFATWSVTRGLDGTPARIEFVSKMMRHTSVAQTEQYIERLPSNAEVIREGYGGRPPIELVQGVPRARPWAAP